MDRHFSSSVGIPMTTHDCDITTLVDPSQQDTTLNLQVKLSQMLSTILASEWSVLLSYRDMSDYLLSSNIQDRKNTAGNISGTDTIYPAYNGWPRPGN